MKEHEKAKKNCCKNIETGYDKDTIGSIGSKINKGRRTITITKPEHKRLQQQTTHPKNISEDM